MPSSKRQYVSCRLRAKAPWSEGQREGENLRQADEQVRLQRQRAEQHQLAVHGHGGREGKGERAGSHKNKTVSLLFGATLFGFGEREPVVGLRERERARRGRDGIVRRPEQEATPGELGESVWRAFVLLCGRVVRSGRCQGKPTPRCPVDLLAAAQVPESQKRIKICVYDKPPQGELSLHEFEQFALDRMRVLKAIDAAKAKGAKADELKETIDKLCAQFLPLRDSVLMELEEDLRKDQISHYILRMAYSRTEELRRWFLRQEEALFKHRFNALDAKGRTEAMRMLQGSSSVKGEVPLATIDEDEYRDLVTPKGNAIMQVFGSTNMNDDPKNPDFFSKSQRPWEHIYKVPFEQVMDLIAQRKVCRRQRACTRALARTSTANLTAMRACFQVFLKGGEAYVISKDLASVVLTSFRARLSRRYASPTPNCRANASHARGGALLTECRAASPRTREHSMTSQRKRQSVSDRSSRT